MPEGSWAIATKFRGNESMTQEYYTQTVCNSNIKATGKHSQATWTSICQLNLAKEELNQNKAFMNTEAW